MNVNSSFRIIRDVYETRARRRQERIESRLTRDLFAFRLSFIGQKSTKRTSTHIFLWESLQMCIFFVPLQGDVWRMRITHVRGPTNVQTSAIYIAGSALHHKRSGSVVIVHGQGLAGLVTPCEAVRVCARWAEQRYRGVQRVLERECCHRRPFFLFRQIWFATRYKNLHRELWKIIVLKDKRSHFPTLFIIFLHDQVDQLDYLDYFAELCQVGQLGQIIYAN